MNMLDEQAVYDKIVGPALDRLKVETIPTLEAAVARQIQELMRELATTAGATISGIQGIEKGAVSDLSGLLTMLLMRLDGWTVSVSIPQITLKLNGPATVRAIDTGEAK